jgi:CubicO group peptidase (beta-lactamase class C family)
MLTRFSPSRLALLVLVALVQIPLASAQADPSALQQALVEPPVAAVPDRSAKIEKSFDALFSANGKPGFTGAVLTIVEDGRITVSKGYGLADPDTGAPVDPKSTRFRVASVSKTVIGSLTGIALDEGAIKTPADPVNAYLADFDLPANKGVEITLRMLGSHRTGLAEARQPFLYRERGIRQLGAAYLERMRPPYILPADSGSNYSNYGATLLGIAAADALRGNFYDLATERIFKPLGMSQTRYELDAEDVDGLAVTQAIYPDGQRVSIPADWSQNPVVVPAGGLVTTGYDMGRYMIALMGGSDAEGIPALHSDHVREAVLHAPAPGDSVLQDYGLLFMSYQWNGNRVSDHGGRTLGATSYLQLFPDDRLGVFVSVASERGTYVPFAGWLGKAWPVSQGAANAGTKFPGLLDLRAAAPEALFGTWTPPKPSAGELPLLSVFESDYRGERRSVRPVTGFFNQLVLGSGEIRVAQSGPDTLKIGWADGYRQIAPGVFYRAPEPGKLPSGWYDLFAFKLDEGGRPTAGSWLYTDVTFTPVSPVNSAQTRSSVLTWSGLILLSGLAALFWPRRYRAKWAALAIAVGLPLSVPAAFASWPNTPLESLSYVLIAPQNLIGLQIMLNTICLLSVILVATFIAGLIRRRTVSGGQVLFRLHAGLLAVASIPFIWAAWSFGWIGWNVG